MLRFQCCNFNAACHIFRNLADRFTVDGTPSLRRPGAGPGRLTTDQRAAPLANCLGENPITRLNAAPNALSDS